jgi:hypothetical protein
MSEKQVDEEKNPVLYEIGGVKIRKDNYQKIRFNEAEYARLAKQAMLSGVSIAKIIALSAQPCTVCGNDHVAINISLALISTKKQLSGRNKKPESIKEAS